MRWLLVLGLLAGCPSNDAAPPTPEPPTIASDARAVQEAPAAASSPVRLFPGKVRSLRLRRSISVRAQPRADADNLGTVARDTRVGFKDAARGAGCESRWIEIIPRGWVCEKYLEPSERLPRGVEIPKLNRGTIVPGRFGKIVGEEAVAYRFPEEGADADAGLVVSRPLVGSVTVREQGLREHEGSIYWHIGGREWVEEEVVRQHQPARHVGTRIGDDTGLTLPLAFAVFHRDPVHRAPAFESPAEKVAKGKVLARMPLSVRGHAGSDDAPTHYQLNDGRWLRARDVRWIRATSSPAGTEPHERWFDVDLDAQTLVAYEGNVPVYATFVSTGRRGYATETGIFRVWIKFAETTMTGQMADEPSYSMAKVPWTQFYAKDLALHTAYWHDKFGVRKSHGCVNLSPRDARFLYFWSEPNVPAGWSMAHGNVEYPGSMVRVRSSADPEPEPKGYAKKVLEERQARSSSSSAATVSP